MRVLVTGGAGFIGRALVKHCLAHHHTVTVVDNLHAGRSENLDDFKGNFTLAKIDILDTEQLIDVFGHSRPETVFHLAAHHFIPFCNDHPSETLRVNVEGTHSVFNTASQHRVKTAVLASSGAFYPSKQEPLDETTVPQPVDIYGLSKLMAEGVASFISDNSPMRCIAARLFNTYGPYETNPHLVPEITSYLHQGKVLRLGNLKTKRDYIYVDDVAELLLLCGAQATDTFSTVNIGTGIEYSAEDIVRTIGEVLGRPIEIAVDPERLRKVDKMHQQADITRLRKLTGTGPRYTLTEGIKLLLDHEGIK